MDLGDVAKAGKAIGKAVPKLEEVAKDSMAWVKHSEKRTQQNQKIFDDIEDLRNDLSDAESDYYNGIDDGEGWDTLRGLYKQNVLKMADNMEVPKGLKDNINNELWYLTHNAVPSDTDFSIHNIINDYHNKIYRMPPEDKNIFDNIVNMKMPKISDDAMSNAREHLDFASNLLPKLKKLTPPQQETFLKLYPEWEGTEDELLTTARLL